MPVEIQFVAGAAQFTGLTGAGLFIPAKARTGGEEIQCRINSVRYHSIGAKHSIELRAVQPSNPLNRPLELSDKDCGPMNDFTLEGAVLPNEVVDGEAISWAFELTTTGKAGDAWWTINYDLVKMRQ